MGKEYLPLFLDFNETTQDLTDEECGRLLRAVVDYANGRDYAWRLTGAEKVAFRFMKGAVDRNKKISEARAKAGATRNKPEQNEANDSKPEQNEQSPEAEANREELKKLKQREKEEKEQQQQFFDRFWSVYPRKVAKEQARKAFAKISPDGTLIETMISAVEKQKQSDQWRKDGGQFIPHPATWLNNHRWEDVVSVNQYNPNSAHNFTERDYEGVQEQLIKEQSRYITEMLCKENGLWDEENNKPVEGWREKLDAMEGEKEQ